MNKIRNFIVMLYEAIVLILPIAVIYLIEKDILSFHVLCCIFLLCIPTCIHNGILGRKLKNVLDKTMRI